MHLPRLYPIIDADLLAQRNVPLVPFASELAAAGVKLLQYRDKSAAPQTILENTARIREAAPGVTLILNDRADLTVLAGWDGTHVGQTDLPPSAVRNVAGPDRIIGLSTHNLEQFEQGLGTEADYLAVGPIYATTTKQNPDPTTGLSLLRQLRKLTHKPIVAIGGITLDTACEVIEAGADSIALISALVPAGPAAAAPPLVEAFLARLEGC